MSAIFRHILVPIDGSPLSMRAAKLALKVARSGGARITAFHAIPTFTPVAYMDGVLPYPELYSPAEYKRASESGAKRMLARIARLAKAAKVRCETAFTTADAPWRAIIQAARAKRCDLIVMSSHGRKGLEAVVLGSVTTKVLTHSKTPVLVCR
jgi:nucleotide-binding universal stress UspA family protein